MKIRVIDYRTNSSRKNDCRLVISIEIETPESILNTSAIIQLHPISYFASKVPRVSFGMLYLSAIVYAIDRAVDRSRYSVDGWSREFEVSIKLPECSVFQANRDDINRMLSFLTGDYWTCDFVGDASITYAKYKPTDYFEGITEVSLFSGGMDSLIGVIDYMESHPKGKLFLASHYDSFMTGPKSDQDKVKMHLLNKYNGLFCSIPAVMITPEKSIELSCRSRSLMFISIALIFASYANCNIIIPENGSVSLNFPLSPSRRASCSTRTTHPVFIKQLQSLLSMLGLSTLLVNPYEKETKGEMVRNCLNKDYLLQVVTYSNSCGKRGMHQHMYDNHSATHCGHCMPCMYRKAALCSELDNTTYGNQFITLFNKKGQKVSEDFFAMLNFLRKQLSEDEIEKELIISGMRSFSDLKDYVNLVIRTRAELANMLMNSDNPVIVKYINRL